MEDTSKLTKKERKALEFKQKKTKEERDEEKSKKEEENAKKRTLEEAQDEAKKEGDSENPPKKRKTRRGKKGKGVNGGKGPRFILFVGNLPYDIEEAELMVHFKNSKPDRLRIRQDKGIAFMEFDNDTKEIQSKMELALLKHHSTLRTRKINVELTVGGGGNSENRVNKLKAKNETLLEERRDKIVKDKMAAAEKKKNAAANAAANASAEDTSATSGGIHPARAALMK